MEFKMESYDEVKVVKLPDELTSDVIGEFEMSIKKIVEDGAYKLILDFSNTNYICSRAVGIIAYIVGKVRNKGGDIKLVALTPFVKKLFEVIRLDRIFEIYNTVEEAVAKF